MLFLPATHLCLHHFRFLLLMTALPFHFKETEKNGGRGENEKKIKNTQSWREEADEEALAEIVRHQSLRGDELLVALKWNWVGAAERNQCLPMHLIALWEQAGYLCLMGRDPIPMPWGTHFHWKQNAPMACHLSTGSWGHMTVNFIPFLWYRYLRGK